MHNLLIALLVIALGLVDCKADSTKFKHEVVGFRLSYWIPLGQMARYQLPTDGFIKDGTSFELNYAYFLHPNLGLGLIGDFAFLNRNLPAFTQFQRAELSKQKLSPLSFESNENAPSIMFSIGLGPILCIPISDARLYFGFQPGISFFNYQPLAFEYSIEGEKSYIEWRGINETYGFQNTFSFALEIPISKMFRVSPTLYYRYGSIQQTLQVVQIKNKILQREQLFDYTISAQNIQFGINFQMRIP